MSHRRIAGLYDVCVLCQLNLYFLSFTLYSIWLICVNLADLPFEGMICLEMPMSGYIAFDIRHKMYEKRFLLPFKS